MKTKKIAAVLLTCIVAIGLMAGCGASNTNQSTSTKQSGNEEADTNSENTTDTTENTSTGNGKHWLYIIQLQEIQKMLLKR